MKTRNRLAIIAIIAINFAFATSCGPAPENKSSSAPSSTSQAQVVTEADSADRPESEPGPYMELLPFSKTNPDFAPDYGFAVDYVLPQSNTRKLADDTFDPLGNNELDPSIQQLPIARNEILARHGYVFKTPALQTYFSGKSWYKPDPSITTDALSSVEKFNLSLLEFWEQKHYNYYGMPELSPLKNDTAITLYPPNQPQSVDLNGDGLPENILWSPVVAENEDTVEASSKLTINDQRFEVKQDNFESDFGIIDIDTSDPYKEVIISSYLDTGDSDSSMIYGFDGKQYALLITVSGGMNDSIIVNGSGKFTALLNGNLLELLPLNQSYEMTNTHQIKAIPQDTYPTDSLVFIKHPLQLFSERDLSKPSFILTEGTIVTLISTDAQAWCQAETSNGSKGWFSVKDRTIVHENLYCDDAFIGLYFAW